jgi:N-methylhydantoinase B
VTAVASTAFGTDLKETKSPDREEHLPSKIPHRRTKARDIVRTVSPCGGGYGDPLARDPAAVLADVLDGHDVRDAVSAAWSLLSNRLGAQAGVADPSPEYLASLHRRLADRPRPWAQAPAPPTLPPSPDLRDLAW